MKSAVNNMDEPSNAVFRLVLRKRRDSNPNELALDPRDVFVDL